MSEREQVISLLKQCLEDWPYAATRVPTIMNRIQDAVAILEKQETLDTMDDLISRKALLAAYDERHKGPPGGARELIEDVPSVPAVPMDKLCEWLGGEGMLAPCYFDQQCDDCELKAYWRNKKSECWKKWLTEQMEGLDAEVH